MSIDTKAVVRRALHFSSIPEVIEEAERLAAAEREGRLKSLGNWTCGQVFNHVASWAGYLYDGFPADLTSPPWILKPLLKALKAKYIKNGFPQGVRIPRVEGGTVGAEQLSTQEGLKKLRGAMARLDSTPPIYPSPAFGMLTHEEAKAINMRHAELHFGYLQPQ